jgi:hypothetical protein
MGSEPNSWSRGGEAERYSPLPSFLGLPARVWRVLPRAGKVALGALLVVLVALMAVLIPPALDNAGENRENERLASEAYRERLRLQLVEEQRPRRATLAPPVEVADIEAAVGADFERRVAAGDLDGPAGETNCRHLRRTQEAGATIFTCLAQQGRSSGVYAERRLVSGYRFRARAITATGAVAWCKENPQPLHPDQEEFVVVPLPKACTG